MTRDVLIQEIAAAIVTTRDFCGCESEAIDEVFADLGIPRDPSIVSEAYREANGEWRRCQKAAGVPRKYWKY